MKILRYTLFTFALVIGFSVTSFAQKDQKDPPPKKDPPVVVAPKDKDRDKPKDNGGKDNKGKKPESYFEE